MSRTIPYSPDYGAPTHDRATRKGVSRFQRFFNRLMEARLRAAEARIRERGYLIPGELDQGADWKVTARSEDSLPFGR